METEVIITDTQFLGIGSIVTVKTLDGPIMIVTDKAVPLSQRPLRGKEGEWICRWYNKLSGKFEHEAFYSGDLEMAVVIPKEDD